MQIPRLLDLSRAVIAALLTVSLTSSALAQATRISRTETDLQDLSRRLPAGEIGSRDDLPLRSNLNTTRPIDYSKVDKRALANLMKEAFDESGLLYKSLDADYRRNPQLRSLMTDLLKLRNQTNRIYQDLTAGISLETIVVDFRELDAGWRLFSHRMAQSTGLSTATRQSVERIDRIDQQAGKLFQLEPTLDRRALSQQLGIMENSLFNMSDELRRDVNASPKMTQLVSDARKLQQQVARITQIVQTGLPYDRIVTEYNRFERAWELMLEQLGVVTNPYVERAVRRVVDADSQMHELLWLETTTNRALLKQTADALIRVVDEFYSRTPLKLLLTFKNATSTLQVADNFYGTVQNFRDNLARNESDAVLLDSYRYVEEYGVVFIRTFSTMKSQAAMVVLREIEDGMAAMRAQLHLGGTVSQVDTRKLLPVAASLENLADQLDYDIRQWMNRERPAFRTEVNAASVAFMKRTQRLHRMLDTEPSLQELQREMDSLYQEWMTVYGFLARCRTEDRANLSQVASEIRIDLTDLNGLLRL